MRGERLDSGPSLDVDSEEIDLRGRPAPPPEPRGRDSSTLGGDGDAEPVDTRSEGAGDRSFAHREGRRVGPSSQSASSRGSTADTSADGRMAVPLRAGPSPRRRVRRGLRVVALAAVVLAAVAGAVVMGSRALTGSGSSTTATADGPADGTTNDSPPPTVAPPGVPVPAVGSAERARAGAALAANPALTLENDTRQQLGEGRIDERVMALLATLVVDRQLVVTAFPSVDGADDGVRRSVEISAVDGVDLRAGSPQTDGLLDAVGAQQGRFAPARAALVDGPETEPTPLQIVYPAPAPTEDIR